ncbi:MAG: late competence development ComFB family protein [Veillonellales bacterium]
MHIKNYMEDLVWDHLDRIIESSNTCNCEKCRYDIAALALNFLPPRYVVTDRGETYTRVKALEQQFYVDVITAISNAVQIVRSRPHHEDGK